MITKIEGDTVIVTSYGFVPGTYSLKEFTAEQLLEERRILFAYWQSHPNCNMMHDLDKKIANAIDKKCNEKTQIRRKEK